MIALLVRLLSQRNRQHITALLVTAAACVLVGGTLFALSQDLPFTTGLYWAITTATTVGYGDVTPHNGVGRLISSAVMLTTIPLLAAVFALVTGEPPRPESGGYSAWKVSSPRVPTGSWSG